MSVFSRFNLRGVLFSGGVPEARLPALFQSESVNTPSGISRLSNLELRKRMALTRALKKYDSLKAQIKALEENGLVVNQKEHAELKAALKPIISYVLSQAKLETLRPDDSDKFLSQLVDLERVHKADLPTLRRARIGMAESDKECRALIVPVLGGRRILSAIYVVHATLDKPLEDVSYEDLPGNVDLFKNSDAQTRTGEENFEGYYTISSGFDGSGPTLIKAFIGAAQPNKIYSTISPVRPFLQDFDAQQKTEFLAQDEHTIRKAVLGHLFDNTDPVMAFHLKNGAYIGAININPQSEKDWITINYVYDTSRLEKNRYMFDGGKGLRPISPPLYQYLDREQVKAAYDIGGQNRVPVAVKPTVLAA